MASAAPPKTDTMSTMNADLARERSRATFSPLKITHLLDGSATRTERRRQLESLVANDPTGIFSNSDNPYLHRTERHKRALAKHVRLIELCRSLGIGSECNGEVVQSEDWPILLSSIADDLPTALHWVMFVPNIVSLCDEEQQAQWLPLCRDWSMIGCYAQTELGHGSNVRALETTATFLPESQGGDAGGSWIIHSPTLTSTKFWPGTLGRTANHAMVIARLIDGDNVDRGIHNFIVPLRSMETHKPLPGVETGDIGPKIGYNVMDNGFARFERVKIPRRNMAMRFATVDEDGKYVKKTVSDATSKVAYITMMQVRAYIVNESGKALAMACTVAVRYSAVRRQGYDGDANADETSSSLSSSAAPPEVQVLDYRQQQHRLLPLLAASYCFFFSGKRLLNQLQTIEERLLSGKANNVTKTEVSDVHATSSALKSFTTTVAADGIEDCRKSCGGHGFLQCSGLPELSTSYLQNPTVEGDNHMLPQHVVKVLLKLVQAVQSGDDSSIAAYDMCDSMHLVPSLRSILNGDGEEMMERCSAEREEELMNLDVLLVAFRHRAARLLVDVASKLQSDVESGKSMQTAWNDGLVQMARASRAYSVYLLLRNFASGLENERDNAEATVGPDELNVLTDLAILFGLYWIERDLGDFLEDGYLSSHQVPWVRSGVLTMLDRIRPNAVPLVDARDFTDFRLKSALGRYDGDVYPAILDSSRRDPLNSTEPGPGYEESLRRLIVDGVGVYTGTASRL